MPNPADKLMHLIGYTPRGDYRAYMRRTGKRAAEAFAEAEAAEKEPQKVAPAPRQEQEEPRLDD